MSTQTNIDSSSQGDERHAVATYLSDLLALERHMAAPVEAQLNSDDHNAYPEAAQIIARLKTVTDTHIAALEAQLAAVGGHPASGFKSAWSQLLGGGAAALDNVRKTKVSKSLRDDYTALALSSISYTMFHATALGLGDTASASLAKRHLDDITPIIVSISRVIPSVVLGELKADGENVQISAADASAQITGESWSSGNTGSSM